MKCNSNRSINGSHCFILLTAVDLEDIEDLELMTEEDKVPLPADTDEKQDSKIAGTVEKSDLKKEEEPDVDPSAAIPPEVEGDSYKFILWRRWWRFHHFFVHHDSLFLEHIK